MKLQFAAIAFAALLVAALPAFANEASFDRNLTVAGHADLTIATGSGKIHITPGAPGQIHISGHIHSNWGGNDDRVQQLAAHPPIEQTGNIVRIGVHAGNLQDITIDYEIQAPADAFLEASAGSGQVNDEGVGINPRLNTGSGDIHATALNGNVALSTGSGSIHAEFTGKGDIKAETGSGSMELRNIQGGLRAHAGSGRIDAYGVPTAAWQIETGSGTVDAWTGNSAFTLEAECGSGTIHSDRPLSDMDQGKHNLSGKMNGGGPEVHIHTGSGSIHIH